MKPHEPKTGTKKGKKEGGKWRAIKDQTEKRRKDNKTLSQKSKMGRIKRKQQHRKEIFHDYNCQLL
jgi:hypothetical protein